MATHTTNSPNTFIAVAPDSTRTLALPPPERATPTVAQLQFELLIEAPYRHTSDDVIWTTQATRTGIDPADPRARADFFRRGQPCLRTSPLTRRYGWGVHADHEGRVALIAIDDPNYARLSADQALTQTQAMRTRRAP